MRTFPKTISPCPIVEAIIELRFASTVIPDAVFGIIYQEFKKDFGDAERLPILQLPEPVRSIDPSLKFQPYYKFVAGNLIFQIGPRMASLSNVKDYMGWEVFSKHIKGTFARLEKLNIVKRVERLGIRYINFFKFDIFDNINLAILMNSKPLESLETGLKLVLQAEDTFTNTLQISNKAQANIEKQIITGSVIDIDTACTDVGESFFQDVEKYLEKGHNVEKALFFSLLKEDFLNTLNPEYEVGLQ